jgi:hypothetical protein
LPWGSRVRKEDERVAAGRPSGMHTLRQPGARICAIPLATVGFSATISTRSFRGGILRANKSGCDGKSDSLVIALSAQTGKPGLRSSSVSPGSLVVSWGLFLGLLGFALSLSRALSRALSLALAGCNCHFLRLVTVCFSSHLGNQLPTSCEDFFFEDT